MDIEKVCQLKQILISNEKSVYYTQYGRDWFFEGMILYTILLFPYAMICTF